METCTIKSGASTKLESCTARWIASISDATGREGDFLATGFSPRKANFSIYIMPGYADFGDLMARLGKHKTGKSCLYVNKLADIDTEVLAELIRAGLRDLARHWPVEPT